MVDWLTKVSGTFSKKTIEPPEPFCITCSCGTKCEGIRTEVNQLVRCVDCKSIIFVLPQNPYPALKQRVSKKNKNKRGEVITKPASKNATHVDKLRITQRVKEKISNVKTKARERTIRLIQKQKAFFTPFRMIILLTVSLVGATGYWVIHSKNLEASASVFQVSIKDGRIALEKKDFILAEEEFNKANDAVIFLERDDTEARDAQKHYMELKAFNHLVPKSLHDIVELASKPQLPGEPGWENNFQSNFLDHWIILDTKLYRKENSGHPGILLLDSPFMVNDIKIDFKVDLNRFQELVGSEPSRRVMIGAQLKSCVKMNGESQIVIVELDSESLFLWSHPELLKEVGFMGESDKDLIQLLEQQTQYKELSK